MRRFLNLKKDKGHTIEEQEQASTLSLPKDVSYQQLIHMTKRGFIAKKIATYLEMDSIDTDKIFFSSLENVNFDSLNMEEQCDQILFYSESILQWLNKGNNVPAKVDSLSINNHFKNSLLKVFDIYKKELCDGHEDNASHSENASVSEWVVYRDVMYSATQGKFLLIKKDELDGYKGGQVLVEHEIKVLADIPKCRDKAKEMLETLGFSKSELMSWLLAISEAITNTLKHAEEGKMTLIQDFEKSEIRIFVEDKGSGFDLESLPKATLMAGFSTKKSLGQGFQLMLKMTKQVLLYTTNQGSTIVLIFEVKKNGDMSHGAR